MCNNQLIQYRAIFLLVVFSMSGCHSANEKSSGARSDYENRTGETTDRSASVRSSPISYHLSFDNRDFFQEEFIESSGQLSIEEREIDFPEGRFGTAIRMNHIPEPVDDHNMTGIDLDLITAAMFNTRRGDISMGYAQPMLWGSGRINTRLGAVAFWARGEIPFPGALFEQTSISFGRTERDLLGVIVDEENQLKAYLRDARYERHLLEADTEWDPSVWNHVVLNWDWAEGMELWLNGERIASSWGETGWFETAPPGLFHLPTPGILYDELYLMDRPLEGHEIEQLITSNQPPADESPHYQREELDEERISRSSGSHIGNHPVIRPDQAMRLTEVWPDSVGDGNIPGWYVMDGRNEMAWPHPYAFFTVIPGDVDFHAEKVDLHTPADAVVNYITLTGNLENVRVEAAAGGEETFETQFEVPGDHGFLYGSTLTATKGGTFRIPFTEEYGTPGEYSFEGARYRVPFSELFGSPTGFGGDVNLPLSGRKRIQNVGLYHYSREASDEVQPQGRTTVLGLARDLPLTSLEQFRIHAVTSRDERNFAVAVDPAASESRLDETTLDIGGFHRLNLFSEPYSTPTGVNQVTLSLPVKTENSEETIFVRVHDPALPGRLWNEFAVTLSGFDQEFRQMILTLDFQDLVITDQDRLWLDIGSAGRADVRIGDASKPAELVISEVESWLAADDFADKQMMPSRAQFTHMHEYMPWKFTGKEVTLEEPYAFGGAFDMKLPALAVQRVKPDHFLANFMIRMTGPDFNHAHPADPEGYERITLPNPLGAPDWALYMRDFNHKRHSIVSWYRDHQNPDNQVGGGRNDDTLLLRGMTDILYDGNSTAHALHDAIHQGLEETDIYRDGFCNIYPMDPLHTSDFIAERYKTLVYHLGRPYEAEREMESAWRLGKPEETPVNYAEGYAFHNSVNVFNWYWGTDVPDEPYQSAPLDEVAEDLRLYTSVLDDDYIYRMTEAFVHTDDIVPYGSRQMYSILLGGPTPQARDARPELAVMWPDGGGPDLSRVVLSADDSSLEVAAYLFDERVRDLTMRLMRISDGRYRVGLHEDPDGNGEAGDLLWSQEMDLVRFDQVHLPIPSRTPVVIRVEQMEEVERPARLPDLAINPWGAVEENGSVQAMIHNLGNGAAENIRVRLLEGESVLEEKVVEELPAASDFQAKRAVVTFSNVPDSPNLSVEIDPDHEIREILKENNRARVVREERPDLQIVSQ